MNCVIVIALARTNSGTKKNVAIRIPRTAFTSKFAWARPKAYAEPAMPMKCPAWIFVAIVDSATEGHRSEREAIKYSSAVVVAVKRERSPTTMMRTKYPRMMRMSIFTIPPRSGGNVPRPRA